LPPLKAGVRIVGPGAAETGIFLLADLSGFTAYLAGVELDHAYGVLRDLLEVVVARLAPPLTVAGLEGGGVFAYAPAARLPRGETLLEAVEAAYAAFRDRQEGIVRRTTCGCRACQSVPSLDLNFMAHSGPYQLQQIAAAPSPAAPLSPAADLLRRRALKLAAGTAGRGYAVFTHACLDQLDLAPAALGLAVQTVVSDTGPVPAGVLDLHARYQAHLAGRRAFVAPAEADGLVSHTLPAPPPVVWEWLNDPARRSRWMAGRAWQTGERPGGRTGPGARNHCDHGLGGTVETILDWRPFEYFTVELVPTGGGFTIRQTYQLEPLPGAHSTRLHDRFVFSRPLPRWLARPLGRVAARTLVKSDLMRLARLVAAEGG
jgi:hypothetical protein